MSNELPEVVVLSTLRPATPEGRCIMDATSIVFMVASIIAHRGGSYASEQILSPAYCLSERVCWNEEGVGEREEEGTKG